MIEEKDYLVNITIRLSTIVSFSPCERDGPITKDDAIANALGHFQDEDLEKIYNGFGDEFSVALPLDIEVIEEGYF